ncbi:hypothetical protein F4813DRAFT_354280 [Daldinia decipiens]|uniref:uncharacterized protein n=1 Tax=Daldinia decipiens TaxID=326647 RepID=UPI0020C41805|nr:uncharacterized protein F4813DRAFT_354280 [Daldinia decipiens]KAI1659232.1 hypothetical protein F4813DRAFT_354280 [Daldinia decipiens]
MLTYSPLIQHTSQDPANSNVANRSILAHYITKDVSAPPPPAKMHASSCPKCGVTFNGDTKKCDSCGATCPV